MYRGGIKTHFLYIVLFVRILKFLIVLNSVRMFSACSHFPLNSVPNNSWKTSHCGDFLKCSKVLRSSCRAFLHVVLKFRPFEILKTFLYNLFSFKKCIKEKRACSKLLWVFFFFVYLVSLACLLYRCAYSPCSCTFIITSVEPFGKMQVPSIFLYYFQLIEWWNFCFMLFVCFE